MVVGFGLFEDEIFKRQWCFVFGIFSTGSTGCFVSFARNGRGVELCGFLVWFGAFGNAGSASGFE